MVVATSAEATAIEKSTRIEPALARRPPKGSVRRAGTSAILFIETSPVAMLAASATPASTVEVSVEVSRHQQSWAKRKKDVGSGEHAPARNWSCLAAVKSLFE